MKPAVKIQLCRHLLSIVACILAGCTLPAPATGDAAAYSADCLHAEDVPRELQDARVVVFGELHGTREASRLVGSFACYNATRGRSILALEIAAGEQGAIDRYLQSHGEPADQAALLSGPHWRTAFSDGRSSRAMFELIERIRVMRDHGMPVGIVAFVGWQKGKSSDEIMADNLRAAMQRDPEGRLVVLVGNSHAARSRDPASGSAPPPMAHYLREEKLLTLNMSHTGGTFWGCYTAKPEECGIKVAGRNGDHDIAKRIFVIQADHQYDGVYHLGNISASPPAAPHDQ